MGMIAHTALSLAARSDAGVALHALFKAAASMGAEVTPFSQYSVVLGTRANYH